MASGCATERGQGKKMAFTLLVLLVAPSCAEFLPKHIALANFNGRGPFDVNQNSSFCLTSNVSSLVDHEGEEGLFAKCDLPPGTLLGEFKGKHYNTPWQVPNDGLFAWKIPRCDGKILRRIDTEAWHTCGDNGYDYVDAEDLDDPHSNPLRFAQQARSAAQKRHVNVDIFIANHRIFYYATQGIETGKEIVVRADAQNWAHARGWHAGMDNSQGDDAPHGFGSGSSAHAQLAPEPVVKVHRAIAQTSSTHKTIQAQRSAPVSEATPVKVPVEPALQPPAASAMVNGGISAAPVWND